MKAKRYEELVAQVRALIEGEDDAVSVMANVSSLVHETMGFWWTGFYVVKGDALQLGPFQGPVACYRIPRGKGVCGTALERGETIIVPDVEAFPGHIACSSMSRSEIVVPLLSHDGKVLAVLDIDSKELATFDTIDQQYLETIAAAVAPIIEHSK
ncbi:MAG: GAF domain-containing protein [Muribaculaceae bacterium]|nr:GAF domain-containing protein [Muribaculaceae bacterium]